MLARRRGGAGLRVALEGRRREWCRHDL